MIWIAQLYLLLGILFLAGKDATSYRLKDHNVSGKLIMGRIKRWHRDGLVLWLLITLPMIYFVHWQMAIYSVLIRASIFDMAFNKWGGIASTYLGGTAWADKAFVKIFGVHGAIKKSLAFAFLWAALNVLNVFIFKITPYADR
jgi:hypothetical protein